ncbi:hypothetical protein GCM10029964_076660 [Kibdelosporangium lantanae]
MRGMVVRRFADAGLRLNPVCGSTHVPLLMDLVAAGLGVTIVPRSVADRAGLPYADIRDVDLTRTIYLAGRQVELANPAARALLTHLLDRAAVS